MLEKLQQFKWLIVFFVKEQFMFLKDIIEKGVRVKWCFMEFSKDREVIVKEILGQ